MPFNSGYRGKRANDTQGTVGPQSQFLQKTYPKPFISGYTISGSDDTALNPTGGQTVLINGGNFSTGVSAVLDGIQIGSVTLINSNQISFTSPAKSSGSYTLIVYNPSSDAAAILVPGLIYSGIPTWTTAAGSIGTVYETKAIDTSVVATSDSALTYAVTSGSIPSGATFYANGVMTGTAPVDSGSTTYTFAVTATDAELQDTTRTFTLTVNTDVVTWSNPANGATIVLDGSAYSTTLSATSAAGYSIASYTANALPIGLTLSGNTISGTPSVEGSTTTLLTATAATTGRSATNTVTWVISLGDLYWNYVTTLLSPSLPALPFNYDASTNNFAITINGDTKPNNFNPYTPGYYSNYFDGNGDYLTVASNAAFGFSTGDFTIECWVYPTNAGAALQQIYDNRTATADVKINIGIRTNTITYCSGSTILLTSAASSIVNNAWQHVAVVRSSGVTKIYINGTQSGASYTDSTDFASPAECVIATPGDSRGNATYSFAGNISNLRVVKGTALYTAAFTPSTSPLTAISNTSLLTCQSNRLVDNSTNNFAITRTGDTRISSFIPYTPNPSYSTYGGTYFDGTGDYLRVVNTGNTLLSTTFTFEYWLNVPALPISTKVILSFSTSDNLADLLYMNMPTTGRLRVVGSTGTYESTAILAPNIWYHIAITKTPTALKMFINGVLQGSGTSDTANYTATGRLIVGGDYTGAYQMAQYISDFRVVNSEVYTANFTPPIQPLTAITNTSLLTCQTNQPVNNNVFIDNSTNNAVLTRGANATLGTFSPYGENWSNYFDGTGDYLSIVSTNALNFGTSDFTVEFWVNFSNAAGSRFFFLDARNASQTTAWVFSRNLSNQLEWFSGQVLQLTSVITISTTSVWYHVAITRNSGTLKFWINGVDAGGSGADTTNYNINATPLIVGSRYNGQDYLSGYISNLRIVKGTAVYTANFTPSTTPLQPIANTVLLTCRDPNFVDDSANNFAITRNGDVSVQKFGPFAGTTLPTPYYSAYFDGNGDYLTFTPTSASNIGTGDFTIEAWVYPTTTLSGYNDVVTLWPGGRSFNFGGGVLTAYNLGPGGGTATSTYTGVAGIWQHIAVTRQSGTLRMFANGIQVYSGSSDVNLTFTSQISYIGSWTGSSEFFPGYISNLRIVRGSAVYTANFTPPTQPLTAISGTMLLTCQSNTFIDNSTNNFAITVFGNSQPKTLSPFTVTYSSRQSYTPAVFGGSMYFDGTGDYVTVSTLTPATALASGNWTIECWFYASATKTFAQIIGNRSSATGNTGYVPIIVSYESATIKFYSSNNGSSWNILNATTIGTVTLQTWNHVAVVRNGNNLDGYLNGIKVSLSTALSGVSYTATNLFYASGVTDPFQGYISDVRLISGTALYTSSFALSNSPLTAIKNTTLLLNGTSAGIYDSSEMNNFETVGDAKLSTSVVKYGNTSMYFDGTGDYMLTKLDSSYDMWRGDLTVEGWFYFNSVANVPHLFNIGESSSARCTLYVSSSVLRFYTQVSTGADRITSSTTLVAGQWYHVALTKSGTTFTLWLNGISQGTSTTTVYPYGLPESVCIGFQNFGGAAGDYLNGYVSDFRITKGYARYTSNFSVPTTSFSTK